MRQNATTPTSPTPAETWAGNTSSGTQHTRAITAAGAMDRRVLGTLSAAEPGVGLGAPTSWGCTARAASDVGAPSDTAGFASRSSGVLVVVRTTHMTSKAAAPAT